MRVLVGCEESQAVCKAFRERGHDAYSCDLEPCSGGHPEWHIQQDVVQTIAAGKWDLIILHPPCTALAVSGNGTYGTGKPKHSERIKAIKWTENLWNLAVSVCDKVVLENPVGVLSKYTKMPKPHYIQPWQFGHPETKKTGLWYHGVEPLKPTEIVEGREQRIWKMPPSKERSKLRSKTYEGIAKAMAASWSPDLGNKWNL